MSSFAAYYFWLQDWRAAMAAVIVQTLPQIYSMPTNNLPSKYFADFTPLHRKKCRVRQAPLFSVCIIWASLLIDWWLVGLAHSLGKCEAFLDQWAIYVAAFLHFAESGTLSRQQEHWKLFIGPQAQPSLHGILRAAGHIYVECLSV